MDTENYEIETTEVESLPDTTYQEIQHDLLVHIDNTLINIDTSLSLIYLLVIALLVINFFKKG